MHHLPNEIILQIASHLTWKNKVTLMTTHKRYEKSIREGNLHNQFRVRINENFENGKPRFEFYSFQVRNLSLVNTRIEIKDVVTLPERFNCLQHIHWDDCTSKVESLAIVNEANAKFWKQITRFQEKSFLILAAEIMKFEGFTNLDELEVDFSRNKLKCRSLIKQLLKADELKKLMLIAAELSLSDLGELACNATQLETLHLQDITTTDDKQTTIKNPTSACKLTDLVMTNVKPFSWDPLVAHLAKNYNGLKQLTTSGGEKMNAAQLTTLVAGLPHLVSLDVDLPPNAAAIFKAMDQNKTRLKKITIDGYSAQRQIEDLLASDQRFALETIAIRGNYRETSNVQPDCFYKKMQGFEKLKHLTIWEGFSCPVNVILQNLKHLVTLEMPACQLEPAGSSGILLPDDFKHNLKNFTLLSSSMNKDSQVLSFLSKACPELSNLSIKSMLHDDEAFKIEFPEHHFTSITFDSIANRYFKVVKQNQTRWCEFDESFILKSSDSTNPPEDEPYISIEFKGCDSLKFKLDGDDNEVYVPTRW